MYYYEFMNTLSSASHIIAVDVGTQCDNRLMGTLLSHISHKNRNTKITYLTGPNNVVVSSPTPGIKITKYDPHPDYFTQSSSLVPADPSSNLILWALTHPIDAYMSMRWYSYLAGHIEKMCRRLFKRAKESVTVTVMLWYPLLGLLWRFSPEFFELIRQKRVHVHMVYCAPGLPSTQVPWLFDSILTSKRFKGLYPCGTKDAVSKRRNMRSGMMYLERISNGTSLDLSIDEVMQSVTHVMLMMPNVIPEIKFRYPVIWCSDVLNKTNRNHHAKSISNDLKTFLSLNKKKIVYVTFGSYATTLERFIERFVVRLVEFCKTTGHVALVHNVPGIAPSPFINVQECFIPYEAVVPHCALVVFTGSVCLQNVCLRHATPMLFVPVLAEQFFWARNYKHFTGVPFLWSDSQLKKVPFVKAITLGCGSMHPTQRNTNTKAYDL
jgi:hypothetical protein